MRLAVSAGDPGKPFLAIPAVSIHPNKLAGDYLISMTMRFPRSEMRVVEFTRFSRTKIFQRGRYFWICPQISEQPPEGYRWIHMGKQAQRNIFRAV